MDLYTVKKEDLKFTTNFNLQACRLDYVYALVNYFTVEFTECHKHIGLSTAPESPYTHWNQTIFFLDKYLNVKKNEEVFGSFAMSPNEHNNREMNITIQLKSNKNVVIETNKYRMY